MKRLILTAVVVFCATVTGWAQTGASTFDQATLIQTASTRARHHRNKQHNHRHHPRHRTARR